MEACHLLLQGGTVVTGSHCVTDPWSERQCVLHFSVQPASILSLLLDQGTDVNCLLSTAVQPSAKLLKPSVTGLTLVYVVGEPFLGIIINMTILATAPPNTS